MALHDIVVAPGTSLEVNNGSGGAYQKLFEVLSIDDASKQTVARVKATTLASARRKRIPGLPGYDELKLKGHYTRWGKQQVRALIGQHASTGGVTYNFRITLQNGDRLTITDGFICEEGTTVPDPEGDSPVTQDITICVNDMIFSAGA